jgi:signal transduction histidine kinase/CheY-like chemotaxis protein
MLRTGRPSYLLFPQALLMAYLAVNEGAVLWTAIWFLAWIAREVYANRLIHRLQGDSAEKTGSAIDQMTRLYVWAATISAGLLPVFFTRSSDTTLLVVMVFLSIYTAAVLISASGIMRAWLAFSIPMHCALIAGWVWHGELLGWLSSGFLVASFPLGVVVMRAQRQSTETLVRVLDDNDNLSAALALERDRAHAERDRAETASESKTRFFAAASHDLRQPLHALSINATTLDLVARRSGNPLLSEVSKGISSALRQSSALLDGLLDISRLDAHAIKLNLAPRDLGAVLAAVREEYAALAAQRGLSFTVDTGAADGIESPWVMTDGDQLLRILGNLVANAVKFTVHGGVTLTAARIDRDCVLVCVTDTGPGIAANEHEKVFEEFYQVNNTARDRAQGLGLGLAIVRRTAALLQVPLRLTSKPGHGTRFELILPAAAALPVEAPTVDTGNTRPLSVLLVDDELEVRTSLCTFLQEIGWTAQGVSTGAEAEDTLANGFLADVLVIDFRLRNETGLDVIERLGRHQLPVVVVTGDTAPDRLRVFSGIAASVLHKPIDGEKLARALTLAVEGKPGTAERKIVT